MAINRFAILVCSLIGVSSIGAPVGQAALPGSGEIAARVTGESGIGLTASLTALRLDGAWVSATASCRDGQCSLGNLEAGEYQLIVAAAGFYSRIFERVRVPSATPVDASMRGLTTAAPPNLSTSSDSGLLDGRVTDSYGRPWAGASVAVTGLDLPNGWKKVYTDWQPTSVETNLDGGFGIGMPLPLGICHLTITAAGFEVSDVSVEIRNPITHVNLSLPRRALQKGPFTSSALLVETAEGGWTLEASAGSTDALTTFLSDVDAHRLDHAWGSISDDLWGALVAQSGRTWRWQIADRKAPDATVSVTRSDRPKDPVMLRVTGGSRPLPTSFPHRILAVSRAIAPEPPAAVFRFDAANFWLNLHQFLYVLGRDASQQPDRARRAVALAPKDSADGMAAATPDEKAAWIAAIAAYAAGPSKLDAVFDKSLVDAATALAATNPDAASLAGVGIPPDMRAALERAAPVYRARFWPAHKAANDRWVSALQPLLGQHGARILEFITSKYGLPWPPDGYPVRVVAFANWAGAFSTGDRLLMISSLDEGNRGSSALETIFHEAMHQWDDAIAQAIDAAAKAKGKTAPANLSHAMIFYTAGEAVRRVVPGHVPYAEANGLWLRMGGLKPALDRFWLPYLNGAGTRNDAIASVIGG